MSSKDRPLSCGSMALPPGTIAIEDSRDEVRFATRDGNDKLIIDYAVTEWQC